MAVQKQYTAKFYDETGTVGGFISAVSTRLPDDTSRLYVKAAPTFRSRIDGGLGECVLDLAAPFDDFDEGGAVAFMNVVDIWCTDAANPRGRRIYRGFISRYEPYVEGGSEGVRVTLLGLASLLTRSYYKDGVSFEVEHTGQDPTAIAQAVIDHFDAFYPDLITYDASSIPEPVGASVSVTFNDLKWFDALRKCGELAGGGWFWHVGADGRLQFQERPATPAHTFTIGRDVLSLTATKDGEGVVNDVQVRGDGGTTDDDDPTSQSLFGLSSAIVSDSSLKDLNARAQRAEKEILDNRAEKIRATIVVGAQYDIESIRVGQTCKVRNFRQANDFFSSNMLVAGLSYDGVTCTLELEEHSGDFGLALQKFTS